MTRSFPTPDTTFRCFPRAAMLIPVAAAWQLNGGLNGTVNISNGAPLVEWNGHLPAADTGTAAEPWAAEHLRIVEYDRVQRGRCGCAGGGHQSRPAFPIDVENGYINTNLGYLVGGGGGAIGQCLVSNGTYFGPGSCGARQRFFTSTRPSTGLFLPRSRFWISRRGFSGQRRRRTRTTSTWPATASPLARTLTRMSRSMGMAG